jgi:uncharacterized membrane protein
MVSALSWLAALCAAPWLLARGYETAGMTLYAGFAAVCHQQPERSLHWRGLPLAVCARCTGLYAGFVLGAAVYPLVRRVAVDSLPPRRWLWLAALPLAIDFTGGALGVFANTQFSRLLTGAVAGAAAAFYLLPGLLAVLTELAGGKNAGLPVKGRRNGGS